MELHLPVSPWVTGKLAWSCLCRMVKNEAFVGEIATGEANSPALGNAILCGNTPVGLQFLIPSTQQGKLQDNILPTLRCKSLAFLEVAKGRAPCWDRGSSSSV